MKHEPNRKIQQIEERRLIIRQKIRFSFLLGFIVGALIVSVLLFAYFLPKEKERHAAIEQKQAYTIKKLQKKVTNERKEQQALKEKLASKSEIADRLIPRIVFGKKPTTSVDYTTSFAKEIDKKFSNTVFSGSVLVVKDNKIIMEKAEGYGNWAENRLNTINSEYLIGSVQKSMTAVLIMSLIEERKLSFETTLDQFFPEVPHSSEITIRSLLDMTSGLSATNNSRSESNENTMISKAIAKVSYKPLTKWRYQSINYTLLAGIIRKVTGQSYRSYFEKKIVQRLSLGNTTIWGETASEENESISYVSKEKMYDAVQNISLGDLISETGTGNVAMSVGDLFTFYQSLIDGKIISKESLRQLRTIPSLNFDYKYAGGVYQEKDYFYSHGVFMGYETYVYMSNDGGDGVITITNAHDPKKMSSGFAKEVFLKLKQSDDL